ncbi:GTPase [hydrothermal vent metagenome]|uniref:GTPase n=2 Tax=root TaxID=1 RepID=A0A1W1BK77_9ZZZZ
MALAIDPRTLDFVALGIFVTVVIVFIYLVIYIHDIPYEIAKKRDHPHRDAIHIAGWVSLFLMHVIWPFLWIWAYLYKPGEGWGLETVELKDSTLSQKEITELKERLEALEAKLSEASENTAVPSESNTQVEVK